MAGDVKAARYHPRLNLKRRRAPALDLHKASSHIRTSPSSFSCTTPNPASNEIHIQGVAPVFSCLFLHLLCAFLACCLWPVSELVRGYSTTLPLSLFRRAFLGAACLLLRFDNPTGPLRARQTAFFEYCRRPLAKLSVHKLVSLCVQLHLAKNSQQV